MIVLNKIRYNSFFSHYFTKTKIKNIYIKNFKVNINR